MGFDWECYLSLAELMNDIAEKQQDGVTPEGFREACQRSAISRSYYGVFCSARNLLRKYVPKIPEVDTHKFVREKYLIAKTHMPRKSMTIFCACGMTEKLLTMRMRWILKLMSR